MNNGMHEFFFSRLDALGCAIELLWQQHLMQTRKAVRHTDFSNYLLRLCVYVQKLMMKKVMAKKKSKVKDFSV